MSQTTDLIFRIRQQGGEQLTRLQSSLKNLGQQATATNVNFSKISFELRAVQAASTQSVNNLRGYANAWREIANSVKIGSQQFKEANAEAARLEAQLKKTSAGGGGRLRGFAQTAGTIAGAGVFGGPEGALGATIGSVGGVPGAIAGGAIGAQVGQFRQLLGSTAQYSAELSKLKIALEGVAGSQQEYAQAVRIADQATRQLNVPQEVAIQGMTRLTAAVKGAGGEVADAGLVFTNITKAIKGTGGSAEDVQGAITAMVQVFSKGKVSAEELSGQLGERLPGAVTLFAKANKLTLPELQKGLKDGAIGLNELMRFIELLGTRYGMTALKIAASSEDAGARLRVSFNDMRLAIGSSLQPVGAQFQAAFASFIKEIAPSVISATQALATALKFLIENARSIAEIAKFAATFATVTIAMNAAANATKAFIALQGAFSIALAAMSSGLGNTSAKAIAAQARITALSGTVKAFAASIAAPLVVTVAIVGAQLVINWFQKIKKAQDDLVKSRKELTGQDWLKSIGGNALTRGQLTQAANDVGKAYEYWADSSKKLKRDLDKLEADAPKQLGGAAVRAAAQIKTVKAELALAEQKTRVLEGRYKAAIGRLPSARLAQVTDFGVPTSDKADGESGNATQKAKEPQDVAEKVLSFERQIIAAKATGNNLLAAQLQFEKDRFEIGEQRNKNEITANKASSLLLIAGERLGEAALNRDREIVQEKEKQAQFGNQVQRQIEDANFAAGRLTKEEKTRLDIARQIEEVRRAGRVAKVPEDQLEAQINRLRDALEAAQNQSKGFGKTLAESFGAGIKSMGDLANNLGQGFANIFSGMADRLAEFVTTGKANFADFARSVLADLSKIFIRFALFEALKAILPGGISKSIFGFAGGGIMTERGPLDLRRYASGGIATSPQLAVFGEGSRPEAYVPLPDGRTIPVTIKGGSTGSTNNVVVNVDAKGTQASGDEGQAKALGSAISIAVQAEIVKQQRPGGILAGTR